MKYSFKISRTLKRYEGKHGQQVMIRVRSTHFSDIEIPVYDYSTGLEVKIKVKKENWNKGYVTGGNYHIPVRGINALLDSVELAVRDAVIVLLQQKQIPTRKEVKDFAYIQILKNEISEKRIELEEVYVDEDGAAFASEDEFLEWVDRQDDPKFVELKKEAQKKFNREFRRVYILDYWDDFIETHAPDSYNLSKSSILNYIEVTKNNCIAEQYNSQWLKQYFDYIIKNGYTKVSKGKERTLYYEVSTIKKYLKHMRSFGKWLFNKGILETEDYKRFELKDKDSKKASYIKFKSNPFKNTHALYKEEFDHLFFFEFKNEFHGLIRDLFVIQTWFGGLRKRDFFDLKEENISKDDNGNVTIRFEQRKTEGQVINPANRNYVLPILQKYDYKLPVFPSSNKYNEHLKEVFEKAGMDRKLLFRYEYINQNTATEKWIEMYKKVSNRWARNCAVSILVEEGYSDHFIMKFTGHEDEKMLKHYRSVHKKEVKDMLDEVKPVQKNTNSSNI